MNGNINNFWYNKLLKEYENTIRKYRGIYLETNIRNDVDKREKKILKILKEYKEKYLKPLWVEEFNVGDTVEYDLTNGGSNTFIITEQLLEEMKKYETSENYHNIRICTT